MSLKSKSKLSFFIEMKWPSGSASSVPTKHCPTDIYTSIEIGDYKSQSEIKVTET
jgi:hypothetical protein